MLFEGYYQILCENHHLCIRNPFEYGYCADDPLKFDCDKCCSTKIIFENLVDLTNGSYGINYNGEKVRIDGCIEFKIDKAAEVEICEHCGHTKTVVPETYKVPIVPTKK